MVLKIDETAGTLAAGVSSAHRPDMSAPAIVDSHCHLDFPDFAGEVDAVIARAAAAGVHRMVTICTRLRQEPRGPRHRRGACGRVLRRRHPPDERRRRADGDGRGAGAPWPAHPKIRRHRRDRARLPLHRRHARPCSRRACASTSRPRGGPACRSSSTPATRTRTWRGSWPRSTAAGAYRLRDALLLLGPRRWPRRRWSWASTCRCRASPPSRSRRSCATSSPRRRSTGILVETDSPYLAPPPHRGKRNEPAYVAHTARAVAERLRPDQADFAALTAANFDRLFTKAARGGRPPDGALRATHPRLRLLGRRAAARRPLGRLRPGEPAATAARRCSLLRRARDGRAARPAC